MRWSDLTDDAGNPGVREWLLEPAAPAPRACALHAEGFMTFLTQFPRITDTLLRSVELEPAPAQGQRARVAGAARFSKRASSLGAAAESAPASSVPSWRSATRRRPATITSVTSLRCAQ